MAMNRQGPSPFWLGIIWGEMIDAHKPAQASEQPPKIIIIFIINCNVQYIKNEKELHSYVAILVKVGQASYYKQKQQNKHKQKRKQAKVSINTRPITLLFNH